MFDPAQHLKSILGAAHAAGADYAETVHALTIVPPSPEETERARNHICEAVARAVAETPALNTVVLAQGVYASAFSGFSDRAREILNRNAGKIPLEDVAAIEQVGAEIIASMQPTGFDTGLFEKRVGAVRSNPLRRARVRGADGRFVRLERPGETGR
jgi:hypothetical protein